MTEEALMNELRSLRSDIDQLNDRFIRLRYQDFREVFVEQLRLALGQEGRRSFETDLERMRDSSECELKSMCMAKLQEDIAQAMGRLGRDDVNGALELLGTTEGLLCGDESPCLDDSCGRSAAETLQRVKLVLSIFKGLRERLQVSVLETTRSDQVTRRASPEGMETALAPLSNSWRLRILLMLRDRDLSLSEMSKALDMKTGHLQFHIKNLRSVGYISSDRRTRTYVLTDKGARALRGAELLVGGL